ncbi:hypothetical protein [Paraconexibacter algicola]|uniref:DUF559 domain-containing protein n=1 Tax=Paraconexibacter algicola TaxID=2133960 RepID=A0A2T4UMJ0_9ACTN|nr:hypothetical protein [Paraconexibacter algicola]PTL60438.1 hypothetical protein C7Y72_12705 [Paraconexibacter algicola]
MDPLRARASRQLGLVARWQLLADGVPRSTIDGRVAELRALHAGVYLTGWAPATPEQRRWAATLTAPWTVLSHESACLQWRLLDRLAGRDVVTRPGAHGVELHDGLRVHYSTLLRGNVARVAGFAITTPERTIIDCWPRLGAWQRRTMLREALRTRRTTVARLQLVLRGHRGRRGVGQLRRLLREWSALPFDRCRSDAEAYALTVFARHGIPIPLVNTRVAGEEADFHWPERRLILELDGPQWHRFKELDARKTAAWVRAGQTVRRLPTDLVFAPDEAPLLAAAS